MLTILRKIAKQSQNAAAPILCATTRHFSTTNPNPNPNPSTTPAPSTQYYDELIDTAGRSKDFAAVRHLLNKRMIDGFYNSTKTFNFIAADLSSLNDLLENLAIIDDWFTRKHAHDSLISQLAKLHRTSDALRVIETMVNKKYGVTPTTFYPIINAFARKKKIADAYKVFDVMRECKIQPDTTVFNYVLTAHCFLGDVNSAADVLVKMEEEGLKADDRTYDALVLGACRAGKVGGAVAIVRRMVEEDVLGLYSTHAHIITAMVSRGYFAQAVEYVKSLGGREVKLDKENFGYLGRRLRSVKRVEEARMVVEEMEKRGLPICSELMDLKS